MKNTVVFACVVVIFFIFASFAFAQSYTPLAPLPGTYTGDVGSETTNLSLYLSGAIKLIIALGAGLSILVAIIGGTQYVAAGISPDAKSGAKERILNAFIGLALVLTSYLILKSINPSLVSFNFMLPPVGTSPMVPTTATTGQVAWPSDASERAQLANAGIGVNRPTSCTYIGEPSCTSLAGLGPEAINGLLSLKNFCSDCVITITAGTEYWLHGNKNTEISSNPTRHKPGGNAVDLSLNNSTLNEKIVDLGTPISSGCSTGALYEIGNAIYVNEVIPGNPPHWHVCY